jgi:hypothetical protein
LSLYFTLMPDGIYEIFDGKQGIYLLFHLLKKCGKQEAERIEKMERGVYFN